MSLTEHDDRVKCGGVLTCMAVGITLCGVVFVYGWLTFTLPQQSINNMPDPCCTTDFIISTTCPEHRTFYNPKATPDGFPYINVINRHYNRMVCNAINIFNNDWHPIISCASIYNSTVVYIGKCPDIDELLIKNQH
jgi:hypothetical protein